MHSRRCPSCDKKIKYDEGYTFDKANNLVCDTCHEIIFPTNYNAHLEVDRQVTKKRRERTTYTSTYYYRKNKITPKKKKKVSIKPYIKPEIKRTVAPINNVHNAYMYRDHPNRNTPHTAVPNKKNNQDQICGHL